MGQLWFHMVATKPSNRDSTTYDAYYVKIQYIKFNSMKPGAYIQ